jgi:hypothetical protein
MSTIYDKERIHRLFLQKKGNIQAVMRHKNMPKSPRTIKQYAKEGRWYEELYGVNQNEVSKENKDKTVIISTDSDDIKKLEQVKGVIYSFLVPNLSDKMDSLELKPKTYAEAVKCYLEVDSRIDEKSGKPLNPKTNTWEEIMRRCASMEV